MKKTFHLGFVAALVLIMCVVAVQAVAAERFTKDGLTYEYMRNGSLKLLHYEDTGKEDTVFIPDTIDGHHVESIGEFAFDGCKVSKITIPDTVKVIEASAFNDCQEIEKITIPTGVYHIEGNPFTGCKKLVNISVDPIHPTLRVTSDGVLYNRADKTLLCYPCSKTNTSFTVHEGTQKIAKRAFFGCNYLLNVALPTSVTEIGSEAFCGCKYLKGIVLPESLLSMDEMVFAGCASLESIEIPSQITRIETGTFFNCESLGRVAFPDKLITINARAFYGCKALKEIYC